jgi:hypothetical protein
MTFRQMRLAPARIVDFKIVSGISHVDTIAVGSAIREIKRLRRLYGPGTWRKLKGNASVRLGGGSFRLAELHRYEAHGTGRHEYKIKRYLD